MLNAKLKARAEEVGQSLPAVFLALKDAGTPPIAKVFAFLAVLYALSPIDLIPDFIPVLGALDDIVIVPLLVTLAIKNIPGDVMRDCRERSKDIWKDKKPVKWYYALPFAAIWAIVIFAVIRVILSGLSR